MRTRYNPQANDIIENFDRFIKDREKLQGILNTDKKICIEIGMGKGDFISNMAKLNPDNVCLLYTSPSPRDKRQSRMPSSA